jgi:hypothetical protein
MIDHYLRLLAHQSQLQQQQEHQLLHQQQLVQAHQQQASNTHQQPLQFPQEHQFQQPTQSTIQRQNHQRRAEQPSPAAESHDDSVPINLSTSGRQNVDRTYTELQTVRPGVAVDATEVLRRHNDDGVTPGTPIPGTSAASPAGGGEKRLNVKTEVILPNTPSFQDSVTLQSVRPAPQSVSAVPNHLPASGTIGRGKLFISAQYENSTIGPIYVETEHELKAVSAIIQQKVGELQSKMETGSKLYFSSSTEGNNSV